MDRKKVRLDSIFMTFAYWHSKRTVGLHFWRRRYTWGTFGIGPFCIFTHIVQDCDRYKYRVRSPYHNHPDPMALQMNLHTLFTHHQSLDTTHWDNRNLSRLCNSVPAVASSVGK